MLCKYLRESLHNEYNLFYAQNVNCYLHYLLKAININNVFFTVEDVDHFSSSDALDSSDSHEDSASKLSHVLEISYVWEYVFVGNEPTDLTVHPCPELPWVGSYFLHRGLVFPKKIGLSEYSEKPRFLDL